MTRETPDSSGQHFYGDMTKVFSGNGAAEDRNVNNICVQTGPGYAAEVESRVYPDHISRCQWEYNSSGQNPCKYTAELNSGRVNMVSTTPHKYVVESPLSNHPYGTAVLESAISGKMKFLCSFWGRILPRPSDGKLRYVGGETRIISIRRNVTWDELAKKTFAICNLSHTIKCQLPGKDLDDTLFLFVQMKIYYKGL
ncbi:hypothetical protein GH714_005854 [Hevea brasiliensis]|uniref:PB1 domain-containing protein n=1 Tax=Hevea brasiliensis TaxID=3981 RepID=A0A6A6KCC0_HEVBR|nr:hypothetical protein GH714_005854 [Hevea brasiliensis]